MRLAASFTLALVSAILLLYVGLWLGSRDRTCAAVPSNYGKVVGSRWGSSRARPVTFGRKTPARRRA